MEPPKKRQSAAGSELARDNPLEFASLRGWAEDDHLAAFCVFYRSAALVLQQSESHIAANSSPVPAGTSDDREPFKECARRALADPALSAAQAKRFFEENFALQALGPTESYDGFLTGYFEPELSASLTRTDQYTVPLYKVPPALVNNPNDLFHLDRAAIQAGALEGQDLELVWLKDKSDVYFVHVQGSARLILENGHAMRVAFAAKTGHEYTSLGKVLCERLNSAPADMTGDVLADWMRTHPHEIDDLMALNQSYIFFKEQQNLQADDGPVGAGGVPLSAGRSLAIDHKIHPYGLPIWLSTPEPVVNNGSADRLMITQDTGSAIVGLQRSDIFVGSGRSAGLTAGRIQSPARMILLVPNP
ncbi:MAG: MltA domain-containing protein [Rhizobiaceae bacterium]